ncbi:hypothetical protein P4O66_011830 [Electrophorus voltai]|uniref:Usher syndrome 2A (autosomal recessive, mild) n=1 Tax=Electrophorus voltai TaxID=2609070 RepID=A0AAD8Z5E6_9TELE|nr:hypothetical protein P4O66_011830 [Electrophorus voltai]
MGISWATPAELNGPLPVYYVERTDVSFSDTQGMVIRGRRFSGTGYFRFPSSTLPANTDFTDTGPCPSLTSLVRDHAPISLTKYGTMAQSSFTGMGPCPRLASQVQDHAPVSPGTRPCPSLTSQIQDHAPVSLTRYGTMSQSDLTGLQLSFRTREADGLILCALSPGAQEEYVALQLYGGRPYFLFDAQASAVAVELSGDGGRKYNDDQWHHVVAARTQAVGTIIVDDQYSGSASATSGSTIIGQNTGVFLGGLPENFTLHRQDTGAARLVRQGFAGCVRDMLIQTASSPVALWEPLDWDSALEEHETYGGWEGCPAQSEHGAYFLGHGFLKLEPEVFIGGEDFEISFEFRTDQLNALLLFAYDSQGADYVLAEMQGGLLSWALSWAGHSVELATWVGLSYCDGRWNRATLLKRGALTAAGLNGAMEHRRGPLGGPLTVTSPLYLGGVPDGLRPPALRQHSLLQEYLYRVMASGEGGWTTGPWQRGRSRETIPQSVLPPSRVASVNGSSAEVRWEEPVGVRGVIERYVVKAHSRDSPSSPPISAAFPDTPPLTGTLNGLAPFSSYSITLTACTQAGCAESSAAALLTTPQEAPEEVLPPHAVASPHSLAVYWEHPQKPNGVLSHFILYENHTVIYQGSGTAFNLTGLGVYTSHRLLLSACTGAGCTNSSAVTFVTGQLAPAHMDAPVLTVLDARTIHVHGGLIVLVAFGRPRAAGANGKQSLDLRGGASEARGLLLWAFPPWPLAACVEAIRAAAAETRQSRSERSERAAWRTDTETRDGVGRSRGQEGGRLGHTLWAAPLQANGLLQSYSLYRAIPGEEPVAIYNSTELFEEHTLHSLVPGTTYLFQIAACTAGGCALSPPSVAHTEESSPEEVPPPTVQYISPHTLRVSWDAPRKPNGVISSYGLWMDGVMVQNSSATSFVVGGLSPWSPHSFIVQACTAQGCALGPLTEVWTSETPPLGSIPLAVVIETPRSVRVKWDPPAKPNGNLTYTVLITGAFCAPAEYAKRAVNPGAELTAAQWPETNCCRLPFCRLQLADAVAAYAKPVSLATYVEERYSPTVLSQLTVTSSKEEPISTVHNAGQNQSVTGMNSTEMSGLEMTSTETRTQFHAGTAGRWLSVGGLLPYSNYSVQVQACNSQGCVESTPASVSLPPAGPDGLSAPRLGAVTSSSLQVAWFPPARPNAPGLLRYQLQMRKPATQHIWQLLDNETSVFSHLVEGLEPYTEYQFRLLVSHSDGEANSSWVSFSTAQDQTPPEIVLLSSLYRNTQPAQMDDRIGPGVIGGGTQHRAFMVLENQPGLRCSTISFLLHFYFQRISTQEWPSVTMSGHGPGPVDPPMLLEIHSRNATVSWSPPSHPNGILTNYNIYQNGELGASVPATSTSLIVSGLGPYQKYTFQVEACTEAGCTASAESHTVQTAPAPPEGVVAPRLYSDTPTSVLVAWTPPLHANGELESYTVERRPTGTQQTSIVATVLPNRTLTYLDGSVALSPWTSYEYRVVANTRQGGSNGSQWERVTTRPSRPARLLPPEVLVLGPESVQVTWAPPLVANGEIEGYEIRMPAPRLSHTNTSLLNCTVTGLVPYTNYSVTVLACSGGGGYVGGCTESPPTSVTTLPTIPQGVASLSVVPISESFLAVSWQPPARPNGPNLRYELLRRKTQQPLARRPPEDFNRWHHVYAGGKLLHEDKGLSRLYAALVLSSVLLASPTTANKKQKLVEPPPCLVLSCSTSLSGPLLLHLPVWSSPAPPPCLVLSCSTSLSGPLLLHLPVWSSPAPPPCLVLSCSTSLSGPLLLHLPVWSSPAPPPCLVLSCSTSLSGPLLLHLPVWSSPAPPPCLVLSCSTSLSGPLLLHLPVWSSPAPPPCLVLSCSTSLSGPLLLHLPVWSSPAPPPCLVLSCSTSLSGPLLLHLPVWSSPAPPPCLVLSCSTSLSGPLLLHLPVWSSPAPPPCLVLSCSTSLYTWYEYKLLVHNDVGYASGEVTAGITKAGLPLTPPNVSTVTLNHTAILVNWTTPTLQDLQGKVELYFLTVNSTQESQTLSLDPSMTSAVISDLQPNTEYTLSLTVSNGAHNISSPEVMCTTLHGEPDGVFPPEVVILNSTSARVLWAAPLFPNGAVTRYSVYLDGQFYTSTGNTSGSLLLGGLLPFTIYDVQVEVCTVYACVLSNGTKVTTVESTPAELTAPHIQVLSSSSVRLEWTSPGRPNGILGGYDIYRRALKSCEELQTKQALLTQTHCTYLQCAAHQDFCGNSCYDPEQQVCCGGTAHNLRELHGCCGEQYLLVANASVSVCCGGRLHHPLPLHQCCGEYYVAISPGEVCCPDRGQRRVSVGPGDSCCGTWPFSSSTGQVCCSGSLHDGFSSQCCGGQLVSRDAVCCGDAGQGTAYSPTPGKAPPLHAFLCVPYLLQRADIPSEKCRPSALCPVDASLRAYCGLCDFDPTLFTCTWVLSEQGKPPATPTPSASPQRPPPTTSGTLQLPQPSNTTHSELCPTADKLVYSGMADTYIFTDPDLEPFTHYEYRIRAWSRHGHVFSPSSWITTKEAKPQGVSPPNWSRVGVRDDIIQLDWSPPFKPNGEISQYVVLRDGQERYRGAERSFTDAGGIQPFQEYTYQLRACTVAGCSDSPKNSYSLFSQQIALLLLSASEVLRQPDISDSVFAVPQEAISAPHRRYLPVIAVGTRRQNKSLPLSRFRSGDYCLPWCGEGAGEEPEESKNHASLTALALPAACAVVAVTVQGIPEGVAVPVVSALGPTALHVSWVAPAKANGVVREYRLIQSGAGVIHTDTQGEMAHTVTGPPAMSTVGSSGKHRVFVNKPEIVPGGAAGLPDGRSSPAALCRVEILGLAAVARGLSKLPLGPRTWQPAAAGQAVALGSHMRGGRRQWGWGPMARGAGWQRGTFRTRLELGPPALRRRLCWGFPIVEEPGSGLQPHTNYSFLLTACTAAGCRAGQPSTGRTLQDAPAEAEGSSRTTPNHTVTIHVPRLHECLLQSCSWCSLPQLPIPPPPRSPPGVWAVPRHVLLNSTAVELFWTTPSKPHGLLACYRLLRDGQLIFAGGPDASCYVDAGLRPGTRYVYKLEASTGGGSSLSSPYVIRTPVSSPEGIPAPHNISVVGLRSVFVTWSPPGAYNTSLPVEYDVLLNAGTERPLVRRAGQDRFLVLDGLDPYTSYDIRVQACQADGCGAGPGVSVQTPEAVPQALDPPVLRAAAATVVEVHWSPPHKPNGLLTTYLIYRRPKGTQEELLVFIWTEGPLEFIDASDSLQPFTEYEYRVTAHNSQGSASSSWSSTLTLEAEPEGMAPPTAWPTGPYSVLLNWTQPSKPNGQISKYRVVYQKESRDPTLNSTMVTALTVPGDVHQAQVFGLEPYTSYSVRVEAVNEGGSAAGPWATLRTLQASPSGLGIFSVEKREHGRALLLQWLEPTLPNGVLKMYSVFSDGNLEFSGLSRQFLFRRLAPYTTYALVLEACTEVGCTRTPIQPVTTGEAPPASQAPPSARRIGPRDAELSWNPPGQPNGIILLYQLMAAGVEDGGFRSDEDSEDDETQAKVACTVRDVDNGSFSCNVSGLQPWSSYRFRVRVSNTAGSTNSPWLTIRTKQAPPRSLAPPAVSHLEGRPQELFVSWAPPLEANGVILSYRIQRGNVGFRFSFDSSVLNYTDQDLTAHTIYSYAVIACTIAGCVTSQPTVVRTLEAAPATVKPPIVSNVMPHSLNASWTAPTIQNGEILEYILQINKEEVYHGKKLSAQVRGLEPHTSYFLILTACTNGGCTTSAPTPVQTREASPTGMPAPTLKVTGPESVEVAWKEPDCPNGVITGYELHRDGHVIYAGMDTHFHDFTLLPNVEYSYTVTASNSQGMAISPSAVARTQSSAPSGMLPPRLQALGPSSIMVQWEPPVRANGVLISYSVYERDPSAPNVRRLVFAAHHSAFQSRSFSLTALQPYCRYEVRVEACTLLGCTLSEWASVQTPEAPPAGQSPPLLELQADSKGMQTVFLLSWSPPAHTNGKLLHYELYRRLSEDAESQSAASLVYRDVSTSYHDRGLLPYTPYEYQRETALFFSACRCRHTCNVRHVREKGCPPSALSSDMLATSCRPDGTGSRGEYATGPERRAVPILGYLGNKAFSKASCGAVGIISGVDREFSGSCGQSVGHRPDRASSSRGCGSSPVPAHPRHMGCGEYQPPHQAQRHHQPLQGVRPDEGHTCAAYPDTRISSQQAVLLALTQGHLHHLSACAQLSEGTSQQQTLHHLAPFTAYTVGVEVCTCPGCCSRGPLSELRTPPSAPAQQPPPRPIALASRWALAEWDRPLQPNGIIESFELLVRSACPQPMQPVPMGCSVGQVESRFFRKGQSLNITTLLPYATYDICVVSYNNMGSTASEWVPITTLKEPPQYKQAFVVHSNLTAVCVDWGLSFFLNGPLREYSLSESGLRVYSGFHSSANIPRTSDKNAAEATSEGKGGAFGTVVAFYTELWFILLMALLGLVLLALLLGILLRRALSKAPFVRERAPLQPLQRRSPTYPPNASLRPSSDLCSIHACTALLQSSGGMVSTHPTLPPSLSLPPSFPPSVTSLLMVPSLLTV